MWNFVWVSFFPYDAIQKIIIILILYSDVLEYKEKSWIQENYTFDDIFGILKIISYKNKYNQISGKFWVCFMILVRGIIITFVVLGKILRPTFRNYLESQIVFVSNAILKKLILREGVIMISETLQINFFQFLYHIWWLFWI